MLMFCFEQIYTVADREEIELCAPTAEYVNRYYAPKTVCFNYLNEELALLRSEVSHQFVFLPYCSKYVTTVLWLKIVSYFCSMMH
jgi:hypothetical protein